MTYLPELNGFSPPNKQKGMEYFADNKGAEIPNKRLPVQ